MTEEMDTIQSEGRQQVQTRMLIKTQSSIRRDTLKTTELPLGEPLRDLLGYESRPITSPVRSIAQLLSTTSSGILRQFKMENGGGNFSKIKTVAEQNPLHTCKDSGSHRTSRARCTRSERIRLWRVSPQPARPDCECRQVARVTSHTPT